MKLRDLLTSTAVAAAMLAGEQASAAFIPPPTGPIFIQYNNAEQFSASNALPFSAVNAPGTEGNWGIIQISTIQQGTLQNPLGSDIGGGGPIIFADRQNGGQQILGIFYGVHVDSTSATKSTAQGGVLDLYGFNVSNQNVTDELNSAANLGKRTAQNEYTGFSCATGDTANCTLLARFDFVFGSNTAADTTTTITTPVDPSTADGTAFSYLSVDPNVTGQWSAALDGNFFTLDPNNNPLPNTPDVRLNSNFNHNGAESWSVAGTDIIGLRSSDPGRSFLVAPIPEPASLGILGTGLLAFASWARRRNRRQK
jgi:PEP-CTERM motif-containing protein